MAEPVAVAVDLAPDDPARDQLSDATVDSAAPLRLQRDAQSRLVLADARMPRQSPLLVNFDSVEMHRRIAAGRRQPLARACGLHRRRDLRIIDATAGLGRDAITLAALGARLELRERHPIMRALLADALGRLPQELAGRVQLRAGDSRKLGFSDCDVIYLDPMFPSANRKAAPALAMQILHRLVGADEDFPELWAAARVAAPPRLVLKRPPRGAAVRIDAPDARYGGGRAVYEVYFRG